MWKRQRKYRVFAWMILWMILFGGTQFKIDSNLVWADTLESVNSQILKGNASQKKPQLSQTKIKLKKQTKQTLKVLHTKETICWVSSNKSVATVSTNGVVTGVKKGEAIIKAKLVESQKVLSCKVIVTNTYTQSQVKSIIQSYEKAYPEGTSCTNENYYFWEAISCHCFGCIAFVGEVSDKVFGKDAKITRHYDFDKIKSGDHIRIGVTNGSDGYHSVLVISKKKDVLTVVEGNYNGSIHWNRQITKKELDAEGFYVETRY